jgi:hypothetical protein
MARMPKDPNHVKLKKDGTPDRRAFNAGGARNPGGLHGKNPPPPPLHSPLPPELAGVKVHKDIRKPHAPIAPVTPPVKLPTPTPMQVAASQAPRGKLGPAPDRLRKVEAMLRDMKSHHVIEQELASEFKVTRDTVRRWITIVYAHWAKEADQTRPHARQRLREGFLRFYDQAMAAGDLKSAVQALDRLARIDGAYEPERIEVDTGTPFRTLDTFDSRMAQLAQNPEVRAALAARGLVIGDDHAGQEGQSGDRLGPAFPTGGDAGASPPDEGSPGCESDGIGPFDDPAEQDFSEDDTGPQPGDDTGDRSGDDPEDA